MDYYDVVMKLVGPIRPVGDESVDGERLENLESLTVLVDHLLTEIDSVATFYADSHQASKKRAGQHCLKFLDDLGIED